MKTPSFLLSIAGLGLVLGACSGSEEPAPADNGDTVEIPSQEDADAKAASEITEENQDDALKALEDEIMNDG